MPQRRRRKPAKAKVLVGVKVTAPTQRELALLKKIFKSVAVASLAAPQAVGVEKSRLVPRPKPRGRATRRR